MHGVDEDASVARTSSKVEAPPVGTERGDVTFDHAIVPGDTAAAEANAESVVLFLNVTLGVDAEHVLEITFRCGEAEDLIVEGREGGCGDKPVGAHERQLRTRESLDVA